jgi:DNA polymerase III epsilon subunit-like protein
LLDGEWGIYPTKLSNVCERLAIELNRHEALSDAMARAKIMIAATSGSTPHEISAHEENSTETFHLEIGGPYGSLDA